MSRSVSRGNRWCRGGIRNFGLAFDMRAQLGRCPPTMSLTKGSCSSIHRSPRAGACPDFLVPDPGTISYSVKKMATTNDETLVDEDESVEDELESEQDRSR